jgi:hypothetical protein
MQTGMNERLNPVSKAELDRRWAAVRKAMAKHGVAALIVQSNNDWLGGYVKWLTDHPATNGYPRFAGRPLLTPVV